MTREQLEQDLRYNEMEAKRYQHLVEGTPVGNRMVEILRDYYQAEVQRLKARLAEFQKEAVMKWE